jgi:hypothetical protein
MPTRTLVVLALLSTLLGVGLVAARVLQQDPQEVELPKLAFDPVMFDVSAQTGGDFYFWEPGEFATADLRLPLGGEDVLLAYPVLDGNRTVTFPVDSLTTRLEILVSAQEKQTVHVVQPDAAVLRPGTQGATVQNFEHTLLATVAFPKPGTWSIEVTGSGRLSLSVRAATDRNTLPAESGLDAIQLIEFELVEQRGRPGHEGLFPLRREARAGEEHRARVVLSGSFASAELSFVGRDGEPLERTTVAQLSFPDGGDAYPMIVVPAEPYRALVRGRDENGVRFQRVFAPLFTPAQ